MKKVLASASSKHDMTPIESMALINPPLTEQKGVRVELMQGSEGSIPHVHVFHNKTRNPKECSYIRLDAAEHSPHHPVTKMSKAVKADFLKIMTSPWKKHMIEIFVIDDGVVTDETEYVPASGYEAAVDIWLDTHESQNLQAGKAKFQWDAVGRPIMPDYSTI